MSITLKVAARGTPAPHNHENTSNLRRVAATLAGLFEQFGPGAVIAAAWLVKLTNPTPIAIGYLSTKLIDAGVPEGAIAAMFKQAATFAEDQP